jgi:catechol 2,3-dioxygenase-like lactoylglutathione lyase family enzyme
VITERKNESAGVTTGVNRIDHYVIQVNDLWRAYQFYHELLGAKAYQIAGMDTGRLWHRGNQILFIELAGHKGVGFSVSNVGVPPATRLCEHYTVGLEVNSAQYETMKDLLQERSIPFKDEIYETGFVLERSLFFQDPDGHTIEICVRPGSGESSSSVSGSKRNAPVVPLRISHMRVEVTDTESASRWFQNVLGIENIGKRAGDVYLKVQDGSQLIILKPTLELSPRREFVRGPHIDFEVPPAGYSEIFESIEDREGYWDDAPHPFKNPRAVDHKITVYFRDTNGNRYQVSPAGSHV